MRRPAGILAALAALTALLTGPAPARAQEPQLVDRIVALVDEEAILLSDLQREVESYRFEMSQMGQPVEEDEAAVRQKMLDRLIEVKLLVAQAKLDGIEVEQDEVDQAVARSLDEIIARFGTRAELEDELARSGMTFADLEARNRDLIRNRLYTSRMISTHIRPRIEVREDEVRDFYEEHKDEVPSTPATVTVSNVLVVPQPEEASRQALQTKLDAIDAALARGEDFGDVARRYSEGPNASRGGSLGSFARGDLFHPVLEQLAWQLPVGQASEPVTTELGMHILQVTERTEREVTLRQILLRVPITQVDWDRAQERAREVYQRAAAGEDFATLVEEYSDDPASREEKGLLGTFPLDKLTPAFRKALTGLQPGQVAEPIRGSAGFFVLRLDDRQAPQEKSYEEVKDVLRQALEEQKIDAELKVFLQELRERFYIDIKA